jgi:hypothetical protein
MLAPRSVRKTRKGDEDGNRSDDKARDVPNPRDST